MIEVALAPALRGQGLYDEADRRLAARPLGLLRQAIAAGTNAPLSSSAGRLFDAMAAFVGIADDRQSFEGEAAMRLEALGPARRTAQAAAVIGRRCCGPFWIG